MEKLNIIITDDHRLFAEGLESILSLQENIQIVKICASAEEMFSFLAQSSSNIDLILLDISLPGIDGVKTCNQLVQNFPAIKILAISMFLTAEYVIGMLENGASGYILKTSGKMMMVDAINEIMKGRNYFDPSVSQLLINNTIRKKAGPQKISQREKEILVLLGKGLISKEIAQKLSISHKTVDFHRSNLLLKFNVKNSVELVQIAVKSGLLN